MATWKERGEVPDSDEEEDLESLSNASEEEEIRESPNADEEVPLGRTTGDGRVNGLEEHTPYHYPRTISNDSSQQQPQDSPARAISKPPFARAAPKFKYGAKGKGLLKAKASLLTGTLNKQSVSDGSTVFDSPNIIRAIENDTVDYGLPSGDQRAESPDPLSFDFQDTGDGAPCEQMGVRGNPATTTPQYRVAGSPQPHRNPLGISGFDELSAETENLLDGPRDLLESVEEVSRSYVELSSPVSSGLSVRSQSPSPIPGFGFTSQAQLQGDRDSDSIPRLSEDDLREFEYISAIVDQPDVVRRRNLRQRAPIQLHPYALEGEKYRQALMARGMKPLRLQQLREQSRRAENNTLMEEAEQEFEPESQLIASSPPEASSPLQESFRDLFEAEIDTNALQSSSLSSRIHDEEDEFPDVADLVTQRARRYDSTGGHRRKTYSTKIQSISRLVQTTYQHPREEGSETFNRPASPPPSSSPILPPVRNLRGTQQENSPRFRRPPSIEYLGSFVAEEQDSLPTPATSVSKNLGESDAVDFDGPDPFASDTESEASAPEEEVRIKRVGKKIRGVLPASWLRLDQGGRSARPVERPRVVIRESQSLSPERPIIRRGVAIPRSKPASSAPIHGIEPQSQFISDADSDDDMASLPSFAAQSVSGRTELSTTAALSELGYEMEDDHVDAMMPGQKRHSVLPQLPRKRAKISKSLFRRTPGQQTRQPKITDHLSKPRKNSNHNKKRRSEIQHRTSNLARTPQRFQFVPPKLSILDIVSPTTATSIVPQFVRLAARNVRNRENLGRHSPTRKFFRLDTREATAEIQSVLQDWREGVINQKIGVQARRRKAHRVPLQQISSNTSERHKDPTANRSEQDDLSAHPLIMPERHPGNPFSQSNFSVVTSLQPMDIRPADVHATIAASSGRLQSDGRPSGYSAFVQPAILETTDQDYSPRYPTVAFRSNKKRLDTIYRKDHKGKSIRGDLQLAKFLHDDDEVIRQPTIEEPEVLPSIETEESIPNITQIPTFTLPRRGKKKTPKRLDAEAARYRQPDEPLILDSIRRSTTVQPEAHVGSKLLGLGDFGTVYTHDFDVFPLQEGVHFHSSTFIGSGKLEAVLSGDQPCASSQFSYHLGGRTLCWAQWDDVVSSELGLCFDWMVERIEVIHDMDHEQSSALVACVDFTTAFAWQWSFLTQGSDSQSLIMRYIELLEGASTRIGSVSSDLRSTDPQYLDLLVQIMTQQMVLVFILLLRSQQSSSASSHGNIPRLQELLRTTAAITISILLHIGLKCIRDLYDDLQYLTFREGGIPSDRHAAEAWVIAIHILQAARIPRCSFWDITNRQLLREHIQTPDDAPVMERLWYTMYSILPLFEFDPRGVVIPTLRTSTSFDNWAVPQKLSKRIFQLYAINHRQPPSFNDYCRAVFSRCLFLMQNWGWRRHGSIVGPLFDFFASEKLAHLRNEEVYKSPRFLEELHLSPVLTSEVEDRCFHILLKIIAVSIKQMHAANDLKAIRNIVTRVLPNHDRQYPKEEVVHQRDLASLRNHHDIFCTLFWAAPAELRPSINLVRDLVNPERAHKEAYMINLRAWTNLARFVVSSDPTVTTYEPFALWQSESFAQLLELYHFAGKEVDDQLQNLTDAAKRLITREVIDSTIQGNRFEIMGSIVANLCALKRLIQAVPIMDSARLILGNNHCTEMLLSAMNRVGIIERTGYPVVEAALEIIDAYMERLNMLIPAAVSSSHMSVEEDSQDYGEDVFDAGSPRIEYIGELDGKLKTGIRDVLKRCLRSLSPVNVDFVRKVVDIWGTLAGTLIVAGVRNRLDFSTDSGDLRLDGESISLELNTRFDNALRRVVDRENTTINNAVFL